MQMAMKMTRCLHLQVHASDPPIWHAKYVAGNHGHLWDQDGPLLVRQGGAVLHKEQSDARQHNRDRTGSFTQVWAAVRRKTLLLLLVD